MSDNLLDLDAVKARTSLSKATIYRMMARDEFPKQARVGQKTVRWSERAIDAWVEKTVRGEAA